VNDVRDTIQEEDLKNFFGESERYPDMLEP
jgi:hypothetical protein